MGLNFAHGVVQWLTTDALNATKSVTGLGFTPKALRFYWNGLQSNSPTNATSNNTVSQRRGIGFAVSPTSRRSVGTSSLNNAATSDLGSVAADNSIAITVSAAGVVDGRLDLNTIDTDGFTLIVDDVTPANISVFWEAWGGTDITVAVVGDAPEPAAVGTQNYTVTGFESNGLEQCVMFAGVQSTAALNTGAQNDSGLHVGFATSTSSTNNITVCGNSDDASATTDTDGYCFQGDCISMIIVGGGTAVNSRANLSAWGTDLFTLNWTNRATSNRRNIFMAIKGGNWRADSYTIAGNTLNSTATISELPFNLEGISLIGRMTAQSTAGTATTQDRMSIGSGKSTTSRNSVGGLDLDAQATAEIVTMVISYDSLLSFPSTTGTVQATYDINSLSANQFQIIVDTAGGVASEFHGYLAFGSKKIGTTSVGHPFII